MKFELLKIILIVTFIEASLAQETSLDSDDESANTPSTFEKKLTLTLGHNQRRNEQDRELQDFNSRYNELVKKLEEEKALLTRKMEQENLEYLRQLAETDGKTLDEIQNVTERNEIATTESQPETSENISRDTIIEESTTEMIRRQSSTTVAPSNIEKMHPYGKPQVIIHLAAGKPIKIDEESIEPLDELSRQLGDYKIAVYSIVGAFRQGKSFLMDYVLRFLYANYKSVNFMNNTLSNKAEWMGAADEPLKGFSWKAGVHATTLGIVIWSDVFLHDDENGEKTAILLMDTQGLFDTQARMQESAKIFALNSLLSSFLIFNLKNQIDEQKLEYLQMVTEYAKLIKNMGESDHTDYSKPFQNLLFLIRDWPNIEEHNLGLEGGIEYVNDVLSPGNRPTELADRREQIKSTFENIFGYLMPHPGRMVSGVKSFDGRWSDMDADFKEVLQQLIEWMFSPKNLKRKVIMGNTLNLREYFAYVNAYCDIFQNETVPDITNVYRTTIEMQMRVQMSRSVEIYEQGMKPYEEYFLSESNVMSVALRAHLENKAKAIDFFKKLPKMGTPEIQAEYTRKLDQEIDEYFERWRLQKITFRNFYNDLKAKSDKVIDQLRKNITDDKKKMEDQYHQQINELNQRLGDNLQSFAEKQKEWNEKSKLYKEENQNLTRRFAKITDEYSKKVEENRKMYDQQLTNLEAQHKREKQERDQKTAEERLKYQNDLQNLRRQGLENSLQYNQTIENHQHELSLQKRRQELEDKKKNMELKRIQRLQEDLEERINREREQELRQYETQMEDLKNNFKKEKEIQDQIKQQAELESQLAMKKLVNLQTVQKKEIEEAAAKKEKEFEESRKIFEAFYQAELLKTQKTIEMINKQILLVTEEKKKRQQGGGGNFMEKFLDKTVAVIATVVTKVIDTAFT